MTEVLARTPLYELHVGLGARMVPFAGHEMPVQYPTGIIAEHNWTRSSAGLFDVSHMGQCFIAGPDFQTSAAALEKLVPADILGLAPWQQRYSQLLNEEGGVLDDLMITRSAYPGAEGRLYVVVNASRKEQDFAHIAKHLPSNVSLTRGDGFALLALQGPKAEAVLANHASAIRELKFMQCGAFNIAGLAAHVTRSGYTGEDGFEISIFAGDAAKLWSLLLQDPCVKPIGLGARDSLRLEAGLCLYGHDIDETTSPVEAGLVWSIGKRRRAEGGFMGDKRILAEIAKGPSRKRIGIKPESRAPAREGTTILLNGRRVGTVTSGGFGPTINTPIAMGYVESAHAAPSTALTLTVRDKPLAATVAALPFVPHNYKR
jgi:aminomethyltransferase